MRRVHKNLTNVKWLILFIFTTFSRLFPVARLGTRGFSRFSRLLKILKKDFLTCAATCRMFCSIYTPSCIYYPFTPHRTFYYNIVLLHPVPFSIYIIVSDFFTYVDNFVFLCIFRIREKREKPYWLGRPTGKKRENTGKTVLHRAYSLGKNNDGGKNPSTSRLPFLDTVNRLSDSALRHRYHAKHPIQTQIS